MTDPLFVLAPGRTYTSVLCGMLGQHPRLYTFPELYLTVAENMWGWWLRCGRGRTNLHHGLLRSVAQIFFGAQTEETIAEAWGWIRARFDWETSAVFRALTEQVKPRISIEKSPALVNREEFLARLLENFPNAHFLHITRHPRGTCESMLKFDTAATALSYHSVGYDFSTDPPTLDPQMWWYESHKRIDDFVARLPPERRYHLHGENFMTEPRKHLRLILKWLNLPSGTKIIEDMMHPERSPYACFGPPSARFGNDHGYLESPQFRPYRAKTESLEGPLPWRPDGCGFLLEVRELARKYGYT